MQQIARVNVNGRVEIVPLGITNLDEPYKKLHEAAPSGWAVHTAYSYGKFSNELHAADLAFYETRKHAWFGEIFHDAIEGREKEEGETCPGEGFVPVTYTVNPGREGLLIAKIWLPPQGLYLPVKDDRAGYRFFKVVDGKTADGKDVKICTLVPEKVASFSNRITAEKAFSEFDLPQNEISGYYRLDDYRSQKKFGGRDFIPLFGDGGRFRVDLGRSPSFSGCDWVGSRPAYEEREVVMEVGFSEQK